MGTSNSSFMDEPAIYRIEVNGRVNEAWANMLWGLKATLIAEPGDEIKTELAGEMTDQAELLGVINTLYNFGYSVLSIEREMRGKASGAQDKV